LKTLEIDIEDSPNADSSVRNRPSLKEETIQRIISKEDFTRLFSPASYHPPPQERRSFKVLIVDDNPFNLMVAETLF
jgi:hypothetical protein